MGRKAESRSVCNAPTRSKSSRRVIVRPHGGWNYFNHLLTFPDHAMDKVVLGRHLGFLPSKHLISGVRDRLVQGQDIH